MVDINFEVLFSIKILHAYCADEQICPDLIITPSAETAVILRNYDMIYRQYRNMLYVGIRTDAPNSVTPYIALPPNERITFLLQNMNPLFFNFTDLPFDQLNGSILYFTNRNNNTVLTIPCLYAANLGNAVSGSDLVPVTGSSYVYTFSVPLASGTAVIQGLSDPTISISQPFSPPAPQNFALVDLSALDAGKYNISVAGQGTRTVYYSNEFAGYNYCGVIEIFNDPALPANYLLFSLTGDPKYQLNFSARSTIWKYLFRTTPSSFPVNDTSGVYTFTQTGNTFISDMLIPYAEKPLKIALQTNDMPPKTILSLPSASPEMLAEIVTAGPCSSKIFVNY